MRKLVLMGSIVAAIGLTALAINAASLGTTPKPTPTAAPATGIDDFERIGLQVKLAEPTEQPKVLGTEAKAVADRIYGPFPADVSITVEYKQVTEASGKARPMYLVTYHNLAPIPSNGSVPENASKGPQRLTVFIDANTGEHIGALRR